MAAVQAPREKAKVHFFIANHDLSAAVRAHPAAARSFCAQPYSQVKGPFLMGGSVWM